MSSQTGPGTEQVDACCAAPTLDQGVVRDPTWHRTARLTVLLSWVSLAWMTVEGAVGLYAGAKSEQRQPDRLGAVVGC